MASAPKLSFWIDDATREKLDTYAERFPRPDGDGNRTEAARQIIISVLKLEDIPEIAEMLKKDIKLNGDILIFINTAVSYFLESRENREMENTLQ